MKKLWITLGITLFIVCVNHGETVGKYVFLCGNRTILLKDITKRYDKINKLDNLLEKYWKEEKME